MDPVQVSALIAFLKEVCSPPATKAVVAEVVTDGPEHTTESPLVMELASAAPELQICACGHKLDFHVSGGGCRYCPECHLFVEQETARLQREEIARAYHGNEATSVTGWSRFPNFGGN
jgi:hypothetical protein